jgi:WD40-like Beta Propeller Repeat
MPAIDLIRPRLLGRSLAAAAALTVLAACGGSGGGQASGSGTSASGPASTPASATAPAPASAAPAPPGMVAVTAAGALVMLSPATGAVAKTLVASGVVGDEVSVQSNGTVFFAVRHGCSDEIESVADTGGTPAAITTGSLPAVSPDGTKIAYASEPSLTTGCVPSSPDLTPLYKLVVRTLSTGAQTTYPMVPAGHDSGLPAPISHLSWAPDNQTLAVSILSVQDNEGWNLALVDTATAKYYLSGAGVSYVPATGAPNPRDSYLREGVYLRSGELFVSRACCAGEPPRNTSRLMWEVSASGALVHQVAIGFPTLDHVSLDASAAGTWLLYLAGGDLYISRGGAAPRELTSGLIAAAWA